MNKRPILSIVIPVYNSEEYIGECLNSVLTQNGFNNDFEVICVDDGSNEKTRRLLDKYASFDSRIRVFHRDNGGAGAARNYGLIQSRGKYIHFLDSDDWLNDEIYESLIKKMQKNDADVCMFQYLKYDMQNKTYEMVKLFEDRYAVSPKKVIRFKGNERFFIYNSVVPWNKIYSREFIIKNNLKFDEIFCANDRTFYYHMLKCNPKIIIDYRELLFYRVNNPNALTGINRDKHFDCHIRSFQNIWDIYKYENNEVKKMILDISLKDFMNFYRKSNEDSRWNIYRNLHYLFQNLDMNIFDDGIVHYNWYCWFKTIKESPYFLGDDNPDFCLKVDKAGIENKYKSLQKEYNRLKESFPKCGCEKKHKVKILFHKAVVFLKYFNENGVKCTLDQIYLNIFKKGCARDGLSYGITREMIYHKPIIVSLTSFPARINIVDQCIISLLSQSIKPNKVVLWLAEEQFPHREKGLPNNLLKLKDYGLEIEWCDDIRSYKKLIPALKKYSDCIIVTADDDNIYDFRWLELLYLGYMKYPKSIQCHRATKFYFDHKKNAFNIISGGEDFYKYPSFLNKLVGLGGVLYPPNCFYKDILNEDLFKELAPTSDDIWFWLMGVLNDVKVNVVTNNIAKANYIQGTQQGPSLTHINDHGDMLFWVHFYNVLRKYPQLREKLLDEFYS